MIKAAGILFVTPDGQALFLKRGPGSDHPEEWCVPGGKTEGDETPIQTAIRETLEEAGYEADEASLTLHTRNISNAEVGAMPPAPGGTGEGALPAASVPPESGFTPAEATALAENLPPGDALVLPAVEVDFTTFLCRVPQPFTPVLCDEHTGYAWAGIDSPPEPLHPGVRIALNRLSMNELGVARAMAAGELTSPQRYMNVTLFAMRITGTGAAYRSGINEYVWRDPALYLNDEFLARCNGLQVIWVHPKKATLDSKEFADRTIGAVMLPYIKGDEVWGIAKVYDDDAIEAMTSKRLSTSPTVVFRAGTNRKLTLEGGETVLFEADPALLDHVAVCEQGVWDKGGEPAGISINDSDGATIVTEEEKAAKADADAKERADAEGQKLDKLLTAVDSLCSRMDAMEAADKARKDAEEEAKKADSAKKDEDDKEPGEPKEPVADKRGDNEEDVAENKAREDKARKDAEEKEREEAKADSAALRAQNAELLKRLEAVERQVPKQMSDTDFAAMADAQAGADRIYMAFGDSAPRPLNGETLDGYQRRIVSDLKRHSKRWKEANIYALDNAVLPIALADVYADAAAAALRPVDLPRGALREVHKRNELTGTRVIEFVGPNTFISAMRRPPRRARIEARKVG